MYNLYNTMYNTNVSLLTVFVLLIQPCKEPPSYHLEFEGPAKPNSREDCLISRSIFIFVFSGGDHDVMACSCPLLCSLCHGEHGVTVGLR